MVWKLVTIRLEVCYFYAIMPIPLTWNIGFLRLLPNFHQVMHLRANAENYGTNLNTTTSIGEIIHKLWKNLVPHTNYKELDLTFCKCVLVLFP